MHGSFKDEKICIHLGDDRGWDGWLASLTRWTWVWVNSGSWWWTGRPGVLRFMESQRVRHDWATDLIWSDLSAIKKIIIYYLFLAALGLCCCAQAFSSCSKQGLLSNCGVWASHCRGFSWCEAQTLGCFSSCGSQAPEHGLSNCGAQA